MTVESATYLSQLDATKPAATDPKSEGDDHVRLIKSSIKATFPNFTAAALSATQAQLDKLVTSVAVNASASSNAVVVDASNNLGVGTASPGAKLDIAGSTAWGAQAAFTALSSDQNFRLFIRSGSGSGIGAVAARITLDYSGASTNGYMSFARGSGSADGYLVWGTSGSDKMTLDASGNLDVGTATTAVTSSTRAITVKSSNIGSLVFGLSQNSTNLGAAATAADIYTSAPLDLRFGTNGAERMRIDASGNLGVGAAPTRKITAYGVSGSNIVASTTGTDEALMYAGGGLARFGAGTTIPITFQINGNEYARVDTSGNLIQSAPATPPTLSTNGTMVMNLTSNTNLRISVRGSDGVTRTANITLA